MNFPSTITSGKNYTKYFPMVVIVTLLFVGGLGFVNVWISWFGFVISSFLLVILYFGKGRLLLPRHFNVFILFSVLFAATLFWSKDPFNSFRYFLMFIAGGFFYLLIFNIKKYDKNIENKTINLLILLGFCFTIWAIVEKITGVKQIGSFGLIRYASVTRNHHHLGDFWVIIVIISIYNFFLNKARDYKWLIILTVGVLIIMLSGSRSALVSLFMGVIFLYYKEPVFQKFKKVFVGLLILLSLIMLYIGSSKGIFFEREYFIQAIVGIIKNPLGIGVGNFELISGDSKYSILGLSNFSSVTHNLILEILLGMGVFGLSFVVWFTKIAVDLLNKRSNKNILFQAVFVALTINFMFDFTYFIPTMLWFWFISLSLAI